MNADVVIVGGGAMGSSTAYHLMRMDPTRSVVVVERDDTYARASTVLSDGNVRIQFNLEENIRISQYAMEVLGGFAETMAVVRWSASSAALSGTAVSRSSIVSRICSGIYHDLSGQDDTV